MRLEGEGKDETGPDIRGSSYRILEREREELQCDHSSGNQLEERETPFSSVNP